MDRETLLAAFPAHRGKLVAALHRLVDAAEAEDLANETLLRALDAAENFRGDAALGTWLHRIATNLALDHLRRRGRDPVDADAALPEMGAEDDDPLERRQMSQCVHEVLATLPAAQRQLLIQSDVLDKTAPEIARETGITPGNAKIRLHRARRTLEAALEARCEFHVRGDGVRCCLPKPESA
jgi:RNA polymerase sigma-70 factor (ECF subfamily)